MKSDDCLVYANLISESS